MANALGQAGATVEPSEYAALSMDSQFTGMWTQRSPLRDADVPYIYRKFYGASRFDSIIDGINREITARLTDARRPGSSVYNDQTFPAIDRFYSFRQFVDGKESIRVIADCAAPVNQVQNPDFSGGTTGWIFQPNWAAGTAAPPYATLAIWTGSGTGAIASTTHIPCVAGTKVEASCWALGEIGATGAARLGLTFWNSGGTQIGTIQESSPLPANYAWTQQFVTATAPTGTAYAVVSYAVYSSTGGPRWAATNFVAGVAPIGGSVRDVTGPHTNTVLREKSPGAGRTTFLGVGNVLYGADGVDTWKMMSSSKSWTANTQYQAGDYIIDPSGNIQMAVGAQTAKITNIQVDRTVVTSGGSTNYYYYVNLFFDPTTPLNIKQHVFLTLSGLTTVPWLNGSLAFNPVSQTQATALIIALSGANPAVPYSAETGTATTGTGISGSSAPTWQTGQGQVTQDGGNQWTNMGSATQPWAGAGPTSAPIVTQTPAPSIYPAWQANTWYSPSFQIVDGNGNLQQLIGPAPPTQIKTGNSLPTWATTPGAITTEGGGGGSNAQWKCIGSAAWQGSHAYAVGDSVQATYTYWTTTVQFQYSEDSHGAFIQTPVYIQTPVTATSLFVCITAGTSNPTQPAWINGLGTVTIEASPSTIVWQNKGNAPGWPGANVFLSLATKVVDKNHNLETITLMGESGPGPTEPTWNPIGKGSFTTDNTAQWRNDGPYASSGSGTWQWAYSGKNSISGEISDPSPASAAFTPDAAQQPVIQGQGLSNPPWDTIILWRTAANGTTLLYRDEFPNPGPNQQWVYTDTNLDNSAVNAEFAAPGSVSVSTLATPPPSTAVAPEYHCGRIFMINGDYVIYSGGPDTVNGDGNSTFPPQNYFLLPEQPIRLKSITMQNGGLVVFCVANTYIILGDGTRVTPSAPPFQPPRMYMENVGLKSYDALCMVGSTFHGMSNKAKVFSFDPANGYLETGFPVGDQFARVTTGDIDQELYDTATAYVTWHEKDSSDTGLYVADGAVGWFRWSPIAPPESGSLWSPRAAIVGGTSAVQSVEVLPGLFDLLLGPAASGPILKRDPAVRGDWSGGAYQGYPSWDVKGSIGICDTGEVAEIVHVALKSVAAGARPAVSLLLDEIKAGVTVEGRTTAWDQLSLDDGHHEDPPNLEPSITMFSDRYKASSTAECPKCENFQLKIDYGLQLEADELLKFAVFGGVFKERRQQ